MTSNRMLAGCICSKYFPSNELWSVLESLLWVMVLFRDPTMMIHLTLSFSTHPGWQASLMNGYFRMSPCQGPTMPWLCMVVCTPSAKPGVWPPSSELACASLISVCAMSRGTSPFTTGCLISGHTLAKYWRAWLPSFMITPAKQCWCVWKRNSVRRETSTVLWSISSIATLTGTCCGTAGWYQPWERPEENSSSSRTSLDQTWGCATLP